MHSQFAPAGRWWLLALRWASLSVHRPLLASSSQHLLAGAGMTCVWWSLRACSVTVRFPLVSKHISPHPHGRDVATCCAEADHVSPSSSPARSLGCAAPGSVFPRISRQVWGIPVARQACPRPSQAPTPLQNALLPCMSSGSHWQSQILTGPGGKRSTVVAACFCCCRALSTQPVPALAQDLTRGPTSHGIRGAVCGD